MCWSQRKCKRAALLVCLEIVFNSLIIYIIWELYNTVQLCQAGTTTFGCLHKTRPTTWLPLFFFPKGVGKGKELVYYLINVHYPLRGGSHNSSNTWGVWQKDEGNPGLVSPQSSCLILKSQALYLVTHFTICSTS